MIVTIQFKDEELAAIKNRREDLVSVIGSEARMGEIESGDLLELTSDSEDMVIAEVQSRRYENGATIFRIKVI